MAIKNAATVYVCTSCDRNPAQLETPQAEGFAYLAQVKQLLKNQPSLQVCGVKCLGGCEANGTPNGCCSIGLTATGKHSYVFNQLMPGTDDDKLLELIQLYFKRPNGRIHCSESPRADALRPHVTTCVPPPKN
ncbi:MAG TPA: DUF1636 family protein [Alphaproteobacteria bacterium]|nr:DUF1636 family protein [Alphaproteobacteria bacterium]